MIFHDGDFPERIVAPRERIEKRRTIFIILLFHSAMKKNLLRGCLLSGRLLSRGWCCLLVRGRRCGLAADY